MTLFMTPTLSSLISDDVQDLSSALASARLFDLGSSSELSSIGLFGQGVVYPPRSLL